MNHDSNRDGEINGTKEKMQTEAPFKIEANSPLRDQSTRRSRFWEPKLQKTCVLRLPAQQLGCVQRHPDPTLDLASTAWHELHSEKVPKTNITHKSQAHGQQVGLGMSNNTIARGAHEQ